MRVLMVVPRFVDNFGDFYQGYNRKDEPVFPNYGRAENSANIAASESKRLPIFFS